MPRGAGTNTAEGPMRYSCIPRSAYPFAAKKPTPRMLFRPLMPLSSDRGLLKRMDVTGARWSVDGAEAVLKLRAVRANGDWPAYWRHHLAEEHKRVHQSRYADGVIPRAA